MPVSKNIKYCRIKANMTQQDLATAIGTSRTTIHSWETKRTAVPIPSAKKVAAFFGIGFYEFCDIDLEKIEDELSRDSVVLTEQEEKDLLMFRCLKEEVKDAIRHIIVTSYQKEHKNG